MVSSDHYITMELNIEKVIDVKQHKYKRFAQDNRSEHVAIRNKIKMKEIKRQ